MSLVDRGTVPRLIGSASGESLARMTAVPGTADRPRALEIGGANAHPCHHRTVAARRSSGLGANIAEEPVDIVTRNPSLSGKIIGRGQDPWPTA